jgi:anti-anti-sigma regulatory factor
MSVRRKKNNMHLKLIGDFDGSSAYQLVEKLKVYCIKSDHVIIDTNALREIHTFGLNILSYHMLKLKGPLSNVSFVGAYADRMIA